MMLLAILACVVCGVVVANDNGTSCSAVRQVFVVRNIGAAHFVPDKWTSGNDLELCAAAQTCCSKSMEEHYKEAVKKDLKNMLQGAGAYLKTLITTSATKFRDTFLDMIQIAENSTNALFSDVYQFMEVQAKVPLGQLFADMLAYISGQDVLLEERVDAFFENLFPITYHYSINPDEKGFSEEYKECLRNAQHDIRPFGDLPEKISAHIIHSFETARTFLEALQLGVEVLNTTEHMDFGPECSKALVRLTYCAHCQNLINAHPCSGLCLNVLRGCLAGVSELDVSWSDYVSALERLASGMVGMYNIEQVLSSLDTRISETVSYLMSNSAEVTERLKLKCWPPRRVSRREIARPLSTPQSESKATSLYLMLQNFVHKLAESKEFYSTLADRICTLIVKSPRCWNGSALDEYTKTVAGVGLNAQKYNPEIQQPRTNDAVVNKMNDKLQHIKQILNQRVTSVPQSDSSVLSEGSGSGGYWRISDDEDYAGASGSGDFQKEEKPDLHLEDGGKVKDSSASSITPTWLFLFFCSLLFLQFIS